MKLSRGIMLGLIAVLLYLFFQTFPQSVEYLYGQLFYPLYQYIRYYFSKFIPIPLIYIFVAFFLGWMIVRIFMVPSYKKWTWLGSLRVWFSIIGTLLFFFYALWGFNYIRPTMEQRLNIELESPDSLYITETFIKVVDSLNSLRATLEVGEDDICNIQLKGGIDSSAFERLRSYLNYLSYPNSYRVVVHELWPAGTLLHWKTAGFFMPFVGEGYIDPGLPNIQKPFVIIHELCHAYGVTQEGEANYLAYKACLASDKPAVRYSGYLAIYPYLAESARALDKEFYAETYSRLDENVKRDFDDISRCLNEYPEYLPTIRDFIYNSFLLSQGVEGGVKNYSMLVLLDYNWEKMSRNNRFLRGIR